MNKFELNYIFLDIFTLHAAAASSLINPYFSHEQYTRLLVKKVTVNKRQISPSMKFSLKFFITIVTNQLNNSKFLPPQIRKTLISYQLKPNYTNLVDFFSQWLSLKVREQLSLIRTQKIFSQLSRSCQSNVFHLLRSLWE